MCVSTIWIRREKEHIGNIYSNTHTHIIPFVLFFGSMYSFSFAIKSTGQKDLKKQNKKNVLPVEYFLGGSRLT